MSPTRVRWLMLAAAAVVLVVHSLRYNFVTDDAYISFVFSRNFAEHGQLAFNLGSPVEGYTNFLWTLILGLLMLVGVSPEISSRVLGTACALGTLYLATRTMDHALGRKSPWCAVPAVVLACSSGFACWTSGGLETQLFTLLVTGALEATVASVEHPKALRRAGILCALAAMTRPEGVLIFVLLGGARLVFWFVEARRTKQWTLRPELYAIGCFLVLWAPWFAWRALYYGYWAPNTYYVKAHGPWTPPALARQMLEHGFHYVWVWTKQTKLVYGVPFALIGVGTALARPATARGLLAVACALVSGGYLAYAISVGGDFMGLHRFIMPVFVTAAIAVILGVDWINSSLPRTWRFVAILPASMLAVGFVASQVRLTRESIDRTNTRADAGVIDTPAFLMIYTENRAAIGRAMAPCFRPDDMSIVGGAGAQPYFGRMRAIDVFGLVSEAIAHDEPRIRARAGHTKFGNDRLLASYDPTFVFSCYSIQRTPDQPHLGCEPFWKPRGYEEVTIHVPELQDEGDWHGTYYTFLAKTSRAFTCPNRVH